MQTPPAAPFVVVRHDDSVTPVCLRELVRMWRNNKQLPASATALKDLSNSLQYMMSKEREDVLIVVKDKL